MMMTTTSSSIAYDTGGSTCLSVTTTTTTTTTDSTSSHPHQRRCEVSLQSALPFLLSSRKRTAWKSGPAVEEEQKTRSYPPTAARVPPPPPISAEGFFSNSEQHQDDVHNSSGGTRKRQRDTHNSHHHRPPPPRPNLKLIEVRYDAFQKKMHHQQLQPLQYPATIRSSTSPIVVETSPGVRVSICSLRGGGDADQEEGILLVREERRSRNTGGGGGGGGSFGRQNSQELVVQNCAGFVVADLCGIGAFEQILLFARSSSSNSHNGGGSCLVDAKTQLQALISGCIITDGEEIFHPDGCIFETIPLSRRGAGVVSPSTSEDKEGLALRCRMKEPAIETLKEFFADTSSLDTTMTRLATSREDSTKGRPPWKSAVERALQSSIQNKLEQLASKEERIYEQRLLLESGRSMLQHLSSTPESPPALQLLRLSYSSRPQIAAAAAAGAEAKLSIFLLIETDLHFQNDSIGETQELREFHLSLSTGLGGGEQPTIISHSGVAKRFATDTKVTMIVAGSLENIDLESIGQGINLNLHAFWKNADGDEKRCGVVLCRFSVLRTHLLVASDNHVVQGEITTFTPDRITPAVVYDCRKPCLVEVGTSSCPLEAPELIRSINSSLSGTLSRVDLISSGAVSLRLALFAFPPSAASLLKTLIQDLVPRRS